jgi:hypothetical protein
VVVEGLDDLGHGNDARDGKTVLGLDLLLRGGHAALADLHAIEGYDEALDLDIGSSLDLGIGLVDGLAAGGDVLDHDHAVAVLGLIAQQVALVGAVVLGLLAVAAVLDLLAVQLVVGNGGHDGQGNALVGRPKQHVKVVAKVIVDGLGVILAQLLELVARHISAGVHKERRLTAALERKAAEFKNVGLNHELDELLLVSLHAGSSRNRVRAFQFSAGRARCGRALGPRHSVKALSGAMVFQTLGLTRQTPSSRIRADCNGYEIPKARRARP